MRIEDGLWRPDEKPAGRNSKRVTRAKQTTAADVKARFDRTKLNKQDKLSLKDAKAAVSNEALDLGRILAAARVRSGVTALELAEKIGKSTSYLSMIEQGKRSLRREILYLIDEQLEITKDDYRKLWAYSSNEFGKDLLKVVSDPSITENPYKQALMYSFARAISSADQIEDIFDEPTISKTLTDKGVKRGPSKSEISFNIKVEDSS